MDKKKALVLLTAIFVLFLANAQYASAQLIEHTPTLDKEVITDFGNGTRLIKLTTHHERILDTYGLNWQPIYSEKKVTENEFTIKVETMQGSVSLGKSSCTFAFFNKGFIESGEAPLFTDTILAKRATVGTESWQAVNSVNNAVCQASINGNELVAKKQSSAGILVYKYVLEFGQWKTQLEATNLSTLTDQKFGFIQSIDLNRDTVFYGNQTRNLDNFNGTTFDRAWLESNEGKMMDLLNGHSFDFDLGFANLKSVTIYDTGINKSQLVFDYTYNAQVLPPNETLIVDPTVTNPNGGTSFDSRTADNPRSGIKAETTNSAVYNLNIYEISFWLKKTGSPTGTVTIEMYEGDGTTVSNVFGTIDVSTLTTSFVEHTFSTGNATMEENGRLVARYDNGVNDGTNLLNIEGTATDAYNGTDTVRARYTAGAWSDVSTQDIKFSLVYIDSYPNAVDDLTITAIGVENLVLSWSAPDSDVAITGYQINTTTPFGDPTTVSVADTGSTDTSYNLASLTAETPYSVRVSAITSEGAKNATGNVANATTLAGVSIGQISLNQTNTDQRDFKFERIDDNSTTARLNVTYSNAFNATCDFSYKYAMTNQSYSNLASIDVGNDEVESSFLFVNVTNEIIDVYCWDRNTGTDGRYLLTQSTFEFLELIQDFRNGEFGTSGMFGIFDFITLIAIVFAMIGFNRVNESVGAIFSFMIIGALAVFEIIAWPTIVTAGIAIGIMWAYGRTRSD